MFTLGATKDRALKQRTLDWAVKSGQVKLQDAFYPIGSVSGSAEGTQQAWEYFQEVSFISIRNCTRFTTKLCILLLLLHHYN